ncbi:MAG TPA: hypothetical protein VFF69_01005 [Phycisphaerales bacterium]|nr:hypothetical protein [Phycisphaerales bacterium]
MARAIAGRPTTGGRAPAPRRRPAPADRPLKLERRAAGRTREHGDGVATFVNPDGRLWLTRVRLVDRSDGGLGVRAHVPAAPGASFSLTLGGAVLQGVVAHARARGGAYRLGLRCARRAAA